MTHDQWRMFKPQEQIGQLVISQRTHTTGVTRWVVLLPMGERAKYNSPGNCPLNANQVILYGYTDATNRSQDWLHRGPWIADLEAEADCRLAAEARLLAMEQETQEALAKKERQRQLALLSTYPGYTSC